MSGQSSHPFTCNTCQVAFRSGDLQRTHMQSDWHRYNLKRRVASLPPLSSEIFAEKVLANKASAAATAARASFEKACGPCGKTYYSENAFLNHLSSQKHKVNAARFVRSGGKKEDDAKSVMSSTFSFGEPAEKIHSDAEDEFQEVVDGMKESSLDDKSEPVSRRPTRPHHSAEGGEDRPEHPLSPASTNTTRSGARDPLKECLFCNQVFDSLGEGLEHMTKSHGLFIPEPDYLEDMEGLVSYLNVKVNEEHQCLYCGRLKWSEDGIKTHMRDMSHCKIAYENEDQQLEIGQFYDFRATYSDSEDESELDSEDEDEDMAAPGGGVKLGAKRVAKVNKEEGDGWETDSTASSVPTEELGCVYLDGQREEVKARLKTNRHHNHTDERRHKSVDGYHSHAHTTPHAVYHDEFEMHLPTGRIAGHRSQNKYWRQNLRTYPTPEERQQKLLTASDSSDSDSTQLRGSAAAHARERGRGREVARHSSAGAVGLAGVDDAGRRQLAAVVKRDQKKEQRLERKFQARVNKIGNSQKHFRDPLLQ